jgi:hypothetical protein
MDNVQKVMCESSLAESSKDGYGSKTIIISMMVKKNKQVMQPLR